MNTYYVSSNRGSDATGTGTAINPWKTISKAIGIAPAASIGEEGARIYLEPGTYFESVTLGLTPTPEARLEILGDCDGGGFLAGGHATPTTGIVDWSAWNNNTSVMNTACLLGGEKSYVTLRRLKLHGGNYSAGSCIQVTTGHSWTLSDLILVTYANGNAVIVGTLAAPSTAGLNLTVERCDFHTLGNGGRCLAIRAAEESVEYSLQSVIRNCRFWGATGVMLSRTETGLGHLASGLTIEHCSFLLSTSSGGAVSIYTDATIPLTSPTTVIGNLILGLTGITAGHVSHVQENWNVIQCSTSRSNVSVGPNSATNVRTAVDREDGRLVGTPLRPFGQPIPGSPLSGFVGTTTNLSTDLMHRGRPEGFESPYASVGALERHDSGEIDTIHAEAGSAGCLALRGPSSLERPILLDVEPVEISVKVRWDGNHGDVHKPQAVLMANPEIGISTDQILTATSEGGSGSEPNDYETLRFSEITPTHRGALMLRLISRSATGSGVAYFDAVTFT